MPPGLLTALAFSLAFAIALAACSSAPAASGPTPAPSIQSGQAADTQAPQPTGTPAQTAAEKPAPAAPAEDRMPAPELADISGWINSAPFTLEAQRGKVVLVDFWTYTCINCIRTLPYLKSWHDKYADKGLVIVGVHTPEFKFEELRENVVKAVADYGIKYAVAQDNEYGTWEAFNNRYWPAKYLVDKNGFIRFTHFGEGAYDETEQRIRELLAEAGADLAMVAPGTSPGPEIDPSATQAAPGLTTTRELYAGFERNYSTLISRSQPPYVLHKEYFQKQNSDVLYKDPGDHQNHFIYLEGLWRNDTESLIHARETKDYEDYVAIKFFGTSVNAVMSPQAGGQFHVRLKLNDKPIAAEQAGADIMYDADGNSYISVGEARVYNLVNLAEFGGHELRLSSNSPEFALFAFTFGAYKNGEPRS